MNIFKRTTLRERYYSIHPLKRWNFWQNVIGSAFMAVIYFVMYLGYTA